MITEKIAKIQDKIQSITKDAKNPYSKKFINHKDGNKHNNYVENLEWVTVAENNKHAEINGFIDNKGENAHASKLKEDEVLEIRKIYPEKSSRNLARQYGVDKTTILRVIHKKTWRHI